MTKTIEWEKINIDPVNWKNFLIDLLTTGKLHIPSFVNFKWIIFQHKVDSNKSNCKFESLCNNQDHALTKTKLKLLHKYFAVVFTFFFCFFLSLIKRSKYSRFWDWNKKSKQFYKITVFVPPAYCLTKITFKFSEQKIFWVIMRSFFL